MKKQFNIIQLWPEDSDKMIRTDKDHIFKVVKKKIPWSEVVEFTLHISGKEWNYEAIELDENGLEFEEYIDGENRIRLSEI